MDRLTARSPPSPNPTTPPPSWPLPSTPHPALINVSQERKRHCRLLPAGMVDLSLASMTAASSQQPPRSSEAMKKQKKKEENRRRDVEMFEQEEEEKKAWRNGDIVERRGRGRGRKGESVFSSLDEMFDSVDELFLTLDDEAAGEGDEVATTAAAVTNKTKTKKHSESASRPMTMGGIAELAEMVAVRTPVADSSSSSCSSSSAESATATYYPEHSFHTVRHPTTTTKALPPLPPLPRQLSTLTPLHSNPLTASEIAHARALSAKHAGRRAASTTTAVVLKTQLSKDGHGKKAMIALDAVAQYGHMQQRTRLVRCVSAARRTKGAVAGAMRRVFL